MDWYTGAMDGRKIGSLEVSLVGLGTNNFGMMEDDDVGRVVDAALEAGINFFDTADSYGRSEQRLGRALGNRRDQVVIATKFASRLSDERPGGGSPDYVRRAVDRSLAQLGTDRIDLYQMHRPDADTPIADTLEALAGIVAEGKVLEIGCSNFSAALLMEAEQATAQGAPRFVSVQNHFNLLHRDDETDALAECEREGLAYLPFFPLASGLLTGKYHRGEAPPEGTRMQLWGERAAGNLTDANFDIVEALEGWAREHGHSVLELAIAWLIANPVIASVIAGATKPEQISANAAAAGWKLSEQDVSEINEIVANPKG
jgi:aryl-alcohol dehydrogenase-like predicted oxidoreductase